MVPVVVDEVQLKLNAVLVTCEHVISGLASKVDCDEWGSVDVPAVRASWRVAGDDLWLVAVEGPPGRIPRIAGEEIVSGSEEGREAAARIGPYGVDADVIAVVIGFILAFVEIVAVSLGIRP